MSEQFHQALRRPPKRRAGALRDFEQRAHEGDIIVAVALRDQLLHDVGRLWGELTADAERYPGEILTPNFRAVGVDGEIPTVPGFERTTPVRHASYA